MLFYKKIVLGCLCIFAALFEARSSATTGSQSDQQNSMIKWEDEGIAAHESNGPEGTDGVPMQRIRIPQIGLVLLILIISGGLALSAEKKRHGANGKDNK